MQSKARVAVVVQESVYEDNTSSGYDTEEVIEPFLQPPDDQRLVIYEFEGYEDGEFFFCAR